MSLTSNILHYVYYGTHTHIYIYCSCDKIEENEMGGACSTYGGGERRVQGFGGET